ncbi:TetR family transcriptional regulator [Asanoa sp. NPDC049518]|uniref:TetR/AcrR family transcriptional regulator n=1 Tax=unclassified Asanoa TaxID=2685164 RepID=UPI003434A2D2
MTDSVRRSDATRAAILRAARERFAADGYERATIRAIAADAAIDPSMVMRYYGNKERLFAAAADFDLRLPDLAGLPHHALGEIVVAHFFDRWDGDETLIALLRAGTTNPAAAERMREIFASQLGPVVARAARGATGPTAEQRAGLAASQILGLALTRYVLRFAPVVALRRDELVAWVAPTIQRYLAEDL